jgi:hypothetical protein
MGTITRSFANNITTSGVLLPASLTNNSIANVTAYNASVSTGGMVLISSQTASASASISFTTGINSTYKEYQFYFINIHPASNGESFQFNMSTDSGSNYNVTKTSSVFDAYHNEADNDAGIRYDGDNKDLAQSTAFQSLNYNFGGTENDSNLGGFLTIFNPSSTTYVKHYIASVNWQYLNTYSIQAYTAGYGNTTSAINAVQFKMSSGNIDDGTILMYGIV